MSKPVVVIGAGLAGLNASLELQKAGREVILLESSNRAGGRVQSDQIDGFICDRGFQLINAKYPELVALDVIEELDFRFADPVINVILANQVHKLGDPRKHLLSVFDSATGTLFEKAAILKVLLGKANPEQSIADYLSSSGLGKTYERVLKPFLRGVYLTKLENISAPVGLEIIRTFITGRPGLPGAGAGALTQALAKRVNDLRVGITVQSISKGIVRTEDSEIAASEIIVATDSTTAAQLLDLPSVRKLAGCTTWYHGADVSPVSHGQLVIDGQERGCVINTLVISNFIPEFASGGKCLISTTTDNGATESDVRRHLAIIYGCENRNWDLIAKYEIPAALPIGAKRITQPIESLVSEGIYLAGDAQVGPSQNGALKSGRLAANAILAKLN
jgi:phytoene dehydrogenase-like protein